MTPRSLVTAIGATAGTPAGTPSPQADAAVAFAGGENEDRQGAPTQLAAWNDSCVIAL